MPTPLYLDPHEGASVLPCPSCGRPLLLAAERMGRMVVGYRGLFSVGSGRGIRLVCAAYQCNYAEDVTLVDDPADAVVYSPQGAADVFLSAPQMGDYSLDDIKQERDRLLALHRNTPNPKIPSLIRHWKCALDERVWDLQATVQEGMDDGSPIVCTRRGRREVGYVRALMHDAFLFERLETGATILLRWGEFCDISPHYVMQEHRADPKHLDFGERSVRLAPGEFNLPTPTKHAMVNGHMLAIDRITQYGLFKLTTKDPQIAHSLNMVESNGAYIGEFPAGLVEHMYLKLRYFSVEGHRLHLLHFTCNPDILMLGTHKVETARALSMRRSFIGAIFETRRRPLRWFGYFKLSELKHEEEVNVPIRMPRFARARV